VHGVTDRIVRGKPTIKHVLPGFIKFFGPPDAVLLAHNARFDLAFLAMALTRLGITFPPHSLFDTLDMARRLSRTWPSHNSETVATRPKVTNGAEHRALADACLVKDIFLATLKDVPTVKSIADLVHISPLLTSGDTPVCAIQPRAGFEALTTAMAERCAIAIVYDRESQRPGPRKITPRLMLEGRGWRKWWLIVIRVGWRSLSGWIAFRNVVV
jgi:DNA polymerase III epsilon subunit-like protein